MIKKWYVLFAAIITVSLAAILYMQSYRSAGEKLLRITQENLVIFEEPLNDTIEKELLFEGLLGEYTVLISDGSVQMLHSNCPDQICVKQGEIHNSLIPIVCLPQKIYIQIIDQESNHLDSIVQ